MPVIRIHEDTLARLDARYGKQYPRGRAIEMLVDDYRLHHSDRLHAALQATEEEIRDVQLPSED